jgi:hypothetical protein
VSNAPFDEVVVEERIAAVVDLLLMHFVAETEIYSKVKAVIVYWD